MITALALIWLAACAVLATRLVRTNLLEAALLKDPRAKETCRILEGSANPFTVAAWMGLMFIFPPVGAAVMFDQTRGGGAKVRGATTRRTSAVASGAEYGAAKHEDGR